MKPRVTLLDVNVLIALCDGHHEHHVEASQWFIANEKHGWATCPLTQNGAIRIMSLPRYPTPRPVGMVTQQISKMCSSANHHFWSDNISICDSEQITHKHLLGHNQITDVYLLALAVHHQARFLTLDAGIPIQAVKAANKNDLIRLVNPTKQKAP